MFTAGLQLLTCAAELSGLTCPLSGKRFCGGPGGHSVLLGRSCL